jgi:competence protein ComEA
LHLSDIKLTTVVAVLLAAAIVLVILGQTLVGALGFQEDTVEPVDTSIQVEEGTVESEQRVYVDVVGEVKDPGLYELPVDSRVAEAVEAAGGFTKKANRTSVNLARKVVDGEQLLVMAKETNGGSADASGETTSQGVASVGSAGSSDGSGSGGTGVGSVSGLININTATAEELMALPGVGEVTAGKIVADRETNGPFTSKEDIQRVSGIGEKKFENLEGSITV